MAKTLAQAPRAAANEGDPIEFTAAVVERKGAPFELRTIRTEPIRPYEVLVRMVASGVCQTDAHSRNQDLPVPLPAVLGHEGAGIVAEVGPAVTRFAVGDHVAMSFPSCGICRPCRTGAPANCVRSFELSFGCVRADGSNGYDFEGSGLHGHFFGQSSFGTYARATEHNLVKIDADMPLELAAPLVCGVQTGAGAVLNSLAVRPGSSVLIIGAGAVGLSAVMAAVIAGADPIIAVDITANRLELALDLGATHTINSRTEDLAARVREIAPEGVDYAIEITAIPKMLALAVELLTPMGTAALVGGAPAGATTPIDMNSLLNGGRRVRGIAQGDSVPQVFIPQLIDYWRSGRLPLESLVRTYEFADINQAFEDAASGDTVKPVLLMPTD
jgi:aryl-alcohol dehydrogenase